MKRSSLFNNSTNIAHPNQALTNQLLSNICSHTPVLHYLFNNVLPYYNICMCSLSKKYLICIPCEHKPFWQLSQLDDFAIRKNANLFFIHEKMNNLLPKMFLCTFGEGIFEEEKI